MNGPSFEGLMHSVFEPFLQQLGFVMRAVHVSGRYYRASFTGSRYTLLVTFEPGDQKVIVMLIENGFDDLESIDDPTKTLRISSLNAKYMGMVTATDRLINEEFFRKVEVVDDAGRELLRCAKDLRLVLPLHLAMESRL